MKLAEALVLRAGKPSLLRPALSRAHRAFPVNRSSSLPRAGLISSARLGQGQLAHLLHLPLRILEDFVPAEAAPNDVDIACMR